MIDDYNSIKRPLIQHLLIQLIFAGFDMSLKPRAGILIAVGVWCLMVVILANAYAGMLLSFLSVTKLEPAINSLEELANSKSCQLLIQGGSDVTNQFLVSRSSNSRIIFYIKKMIYFNTQHEECDEWDLQTNWRFIATSP